MGSMVVEIVSFKLKSTVTELQFMATNEQMNAFLAAQSGMVYRSLCFDEKSNIWTDILYWQSLADAHKAQEAFFKSTVSHECEMVMEKDSVTVQHIEVKNSLDCSQMVA